MRVEVPTLRGILEPGVRGLNTKGTKAGPRISRMTQMQPPGGTRQSKRGVKLSATNEEHEGKEAGMTAKVCSGGLTAVVLGGDDSQG